MKKVFIASMAAVIAVMSMAGCGNSDVQVTPPAAETTAATTAAAETTAANPVAPDAAAADTSADAGSAADNAFLDNLNKQMEAFEENVGKVTVETAADAPAPSTDVETPVPPTETTTAASDDGLVSMRVGDKDHGFITVPKSWVRFQEAEGASSGMIQYCDGTANNVISLAKADSGVAQQIADQMYDALEADTTATITGSRSCEVDGKEAYRIDVRYEAEKKEMYVWLVQAEGAAFYLSVEYTDPDVFELAKTYSTEK